MDSHLLRYDKKKTIVFIDCETFNLCLNSCHNLPWQVAMIKLNGDKIAASKDYLIKWDTKLKIGAEAARITRYSDKAMQKNGIPPEEAFPTIQDWLDNADYIIGHNILGFDVYLIKDYYKHMGLCYKHLMHKIIDTNCLARGIKYELPYKQEQGLLAYQYKVVHERRKGVKSSLAYMGKSLSIEHDYDKLHNALVDLELNVKVWNKLKWQTDI